MVGELQPILNTQISPIPVIPAPDYSSAFAGFFRSINKEGPSVAEMDKQAELAYGNAIKRALAIRDKNPVAAAKLADQAYLDLVASGVTPNSGQDNMYTTATGKTPAAFGFEDQEAYKIDVWSKSEDAVGYITMARKYAQLHPNLNWDETQISAYARSIFEDHQGSSTALQIEKQRLEMGITPDGVKVTASIEADFNYLLGMTDSMLADGRATQEEIKQASTALSQMIVTKYAPFMDANPEVKNTVDQMTKLVTRLGDSKFDSTKALVDQIFEAAQKSKLDPLMTSLLINLLETPQGQEILLKEGGIKLSDITIDLQKVFENMRLSEEGEEPENGRVNVGDMNLGEVTKTDDTKATTSAINFFSEIASTDIIVGDTTIFTNEAVRKQFTEGALAASAVVAAQTDAVLSKQLLDKFGSPQFVKNLSALFKVDEISAVKIAESYQGALASQLNKTMVSMESLKSNRFGSAVTVTEGGVLELDFTTIDAKVKQSDDERFKDNWENIKALIINEGFESYLRNTKYLGDRSRDIDAFAGTNFRDVLKLQDTARNIDNKMTQVQKIIDGNLEAFELYSVKGSNTGVDIEEEIKRDMEAVKIAEDTVRTLAETPVGITQETLPPMEQVTADESQQAAEGTEQNPLRPAWTGNREQDMAIYNSLPNGAFFLDGRGNLAKVVKPVVGGE
jgi:hypothetical protein